MMNKMTNLKIFYLFIIFTTAVLITEESEIMIHDECGVSPRERMKILAKQLGINFYFLFCFLNFNLSF